MLILDLSDDTAILVQYIENGDKFEQTGVQMWHVI
jgi:hypothetical protein